MGREGCREEGRERRDRAIHQPREAGLHHAKQKAAPRLLVFADCGTRRQMLAAQLSGQVLMAAFGFRQIAE